MQKDYPLLSSQLGIFRHWEAYPDSLQYNLPAVAWFRKADTDARQLQQALNRIIDSRQVLHTRFFIGDNGQPRQYADLTMNIPVRMHTMNRQEAEQYIATDFVQPFHLLSGEPLCRFEVIDTPDAVALLIDLHHTIADGLTIARNLIGRDLRDALSDHPLVPDNIELYLQAEREAAVFQSETYRRDADYHRQRYSTIDFSYPLSSPRSARRDACQSNNNHQPSTINLQPSTINLQPSTLSAFALALSKHAHTRQVAFSILVHGRSGKAQREAYGMFVKTLPLCIDIDENLTVNQFLRLVRREQTMAIRHSSYPIHHFYHDLQKKPSVVFGFQGEQIMEEIHIGNIHAQGRQLHNEADSEDSCLVYLKGNDELEVRGMMAHDVATLAQQMALHPEAQLKDISLLSEEEKREIRLLSQGKKMDYDEKETVVDMILRQARQTPGRTAIVDDSGSITYGELDRLSEEVAKGIDSPFVAIPADRNLHFVVKAIGIMRAGAAYVPVDSEWPEERRSFLYNKIKEQPRQTTPLAYMMFTSGTTGEPKGITITHRGLTNLVHFIVSQWGLNSESHIACHSSFAFDASVEDIFPVLTVGGTLFIPNETERHDLRLMYQFLERHHITGGCYTTRFGVMLASRYPLHVDYLCLGGEKLMPFTPLAGNYRIFNTYGPTEFTVDATFHELNRQSLSINTPLGPKGRLPEQEHPTPTDIPIGRPLPNCSAFVVDPQGCLVPQGMVGELLLKGCQLATNHSDGFLTGDLVQWNDEGELEFFGRKDRLLKHHGYRINPLEIERALVAIPHIEAAAVRLEQGFLCAYYQAPQTFSPHDLRQQLAKILPVYLLPNRFVHVENIPLNTNDKTDWSTIKHQPSTINHQPSPITHHPSCSLFAHILQLEEVHPDDNFFDLGGTSLEAMLLVEELLQQGYAITYADLYNHPTPRELESILVTSRPHTLESIHAPSHPRTTESILELSNPRTLEPPKETIITPLGPKGRLPEQEHLSPNTQHHPSLILTGATGFLGIHILHTWLTQHPDSPITCIVRASNDEEARHRLADVYRRYFDLTLPPVSRGLHVVAGDITDPSTFNHQPSTLNPQPSTLNHQPSTIFIHSAADVRYFAPHHEIEHTNTYGTQLVADFCLHHSIPLIHISTLSVLHDNLIHSPYISSKADAEELIHKRCLQGLQAQIIRLGFLAPSSTINHQPSPSTHQPSTINHQPSTINHHPAFFSLLHLFEQMGCYPDALADIQPDVTPVEHAAQYIIQHLTPSNHHHPLTLNLTQPTSLQTLLPHCIAVANKDFLQQLSQRENTPTAAQNLLKILLLQKID